MEVRNVTRHLLQREENDIRRLRFQRKFHVTPNLISRLGLEAELEGHAGCVNCLEWNEKGDLLASGSDDVHIMLWDPFKHKKLHSIQSGHHGNIFSVKFLPNSNDGMIVSGAADYKIRVHDANAIETTMACSCHAGRVKRLAVAPNVPFMFWSAAEDGIIMQFDLRTPHQCSNVCSNVLINLINHLGKSAEAKCLAINPFRPELLAVGANDPYVRLYDRRMISTMTIKYSNEHIPRSLWERHSYLPTSDSEEDNLPVGCVTYFVAGHLPLKQPDYRKRYRTLASTYLTFSPDGSELLANLGGEQIYLFNVVKPSVPKTFDLSGISLSSNGICKAADACNPTNGYSTHKNGTTNGMTANGVTATTARILPAEIFNAGSWNVGKSRKGPTSKPFPPKVEALKARASENFEKQQYTVAISLYNQAVVMCPAAAVFYANRAASYMKRGWDGDLYAALRDCHIALRLDSDYLKAHFRLARCLYELHWTKEALDCLQAFKAKFPDQAQSHACEALDRDIKAAIYSTAESEESNATRSTDSQGSNNNSSSTRNRKPSISEQEKIWRSLAYDYETRFCGHCNTTTDIKEANFFGSCGQYIVAGSDDGSFFMWDRETTNITRVLRGDDSIVNCLQPHPSTCLLATSGIDPVVRLWSPRPEDGTKEDREVADSEDAAVANQRRMNADPLEVMLMNMGYRIPGVLDTDEAEGEGRESSITQLSQCRPS